MGLLWQEDIGCIGNIFIIEGVCREYLRCEVTVVSGRSGRRASNLRPFEKYS